MTLTTRAVIATSILIVCLGAIAIIFWKQELQYQRPTPRPVNYTDVRVGQAIQLPPAFTRGKAYFLHFYNPDCPCSRFNVAHLRSLIGNFHDSIAIVVVVQATADSMKARAAFGNTMAIVSDIDGNIAQGCGVYSTPQAALVDREHRLYYRGNYNRSRYCTSRATNFAELSLVALLHGAASPQFGLQATQSYGCTLDAQSDVELF